MKKYGKNIVASFETVLNGNDYQCLVLDDDNYWNIHVIDEKFKDDELNTLKLQEPKEAVTKEEFTNKILLGYIMEHFICDVYRLISNEPLEVIVQIN